MLEEGKKAPLFSLKDDSEKTVKLADFKGKKVVLYFYPRDNTPGCTKEACGFRDAYDDILAKGAVVVGISADSGSSHKKFREKHELLFYLLADEDHRIAEAYNVWAEKNMCGKKSFGIVRTTFIIDEKGVITKIFPKVKPENHAREILNFL
ncbi:MAG: thioredoxin-dependent thiol peroxidase [Leptospirales bacterium]|nr:thioredoxin-dependent thiol peroxidase [Leptospirales bacterium]